jgi:hypothetical protein
MKMTSRTMITGLSAAVLGILVGQAASACDMVPQPGAPLAMAQLMRDSRNPLELVTTENLARELRDSSSGKMPSIVGMWSF